MLLWKLRLINLQPLVLLLSCFRAGLIFYRVGVKGINKKTGKDILLDDTYLIEEVSERRLNWLILVWIALCLWGRLSLEFTPCRGIQVPESGVWNPGRFCLRNLEPWAAESSVQIKVSGIPLMTGLAIGNPSLTCKESRIHVVESRIDDCRAFLYMGQQNHQLLRFFFTHTSNNFTRHFQIDVNVQYCPWQCCRDQVWFW